MGGQPRPLGCRSAWSVSRDDADLGRPVCWLQGRCIAHLGKGPADPGYKPAAARYGPICEAVIKQQEGNYLANLAPYPGRFEFHNYLPENTSAVLVRPVGESGVLVVAGDSQRCFAPLDQAWVAALSDKLDDVLEAYVPKGSGFGPNKGR